MDYSSFVLPNVFTFHLGLIINKPVLMVLFGLYFVLYATVSAVLVYHWTSYGMRSRGIIVGESLFYFVSAVLFVTAGLSIYYF